MVRQIALGHMHRPGNKLFTAHCFMRSIYNTTRRSDRGNRLLSNIRLCHPSHTHRCQHHRNIVQPSNVRISHGLIARLVSCFSDTEYDIFVRISGCTPKYTEIDMKKMIGWSVITALHGMQTRSCDENSVRPSARPSVRPSNA